MPAGGRKAEKEYVFMDHPFGPGYWHYRTVDLDIFDSVAVHRQQSAFALIEGDGMGGNAESGQVESDGDVPV